MENSLDKTSSSYVNSRDLKNKTGSWERVTVSWQGRGPFIWYVGSICFEVFI